MANFFKANTKKQPVKKTLAKPISIKIDKLDSHGCGVGKYRNKPIFVEGALPTEQVEVKIFEEKNKFSRAKLLKVTEQSASRVKAQCQHFLKCGGCDLQHLEVSEQINFKQQKTSSLMSRAGMSLSMVESLPWQNALQDSAWHYRRKARIGVQYNKKGEATIGFREKNSNQLVAIKSCPVLVKPLNSIFPLLNELVNKLSEKNAIGHIEVINAYTSQDDIKATIVIRQLRRFKKSDLQLIKAYQEQHAWQVLFDLGKTEQETADLEKEAQGKDSQSIKQIEECNKQQTELLSYTLDDNLKIQFSYSDFIQVNEAINAKMVSQALSWLEVSSSNEKTKHYNVLDLFCGLGNFSLAIANYVNTVVGVEGVQAMVNKAKQNAELNKLTNTEFYQADLNDPNLVESAKTQSNHWINQVYHCVLLDPARAGAEKAIEFVATMDSPLILYISCDPQTLARDSQVLLNNGYVIDKISTLDMFVHTKHVETMVLFKLA
ncbi:MAG: 23S rRNA (uracil(1939)-C(5))-methyltransferase RlmD [Colwellia sp.]